MGSRSVAVFVAFFLTLFLSVPGFAMHEPARAAAAATIAADEIDSTQAGEPAAQVEIEAEVEGSMDLPDLVQQLAEPWAPGPCIVRPAPHRATSWRAPVLDGLRRPPRHPRATA